MSLNRQSGVRRPGEQARPVLHPFRGSARGGFTLMELVYVLAIVGMMTTVFLPPMLQWRASARIHNATRIIASDLRLAQSLASRQGTPVRVDFDASAPAYEIVDRSSGAILHRRELGAGSDASVESAAASSAVVNVYPNRSTSGPLTIRVTVGDRAEAVELTRAGLVRVIRP